MQEIPATKVSPFPYIRVAVTVPQCSKGIEVLVAYSAENWTPIQSARGMIHGYFHPQKRFDVGRGAPYGSTMENCPSISIFRVKVGEGVAGQDFNELGLLCVWTRVAVEVGSSRESAFTESFNISALST
jgi:hypothetical protein